MHAVLLAAATAVVSLLGPVGSAPPLGAVHTISGRVTDSTGTGLAEVRVVVHELNRSTSTDLEGKYAITELASGTYSVSFSLVGYAPQLHRITIANADITLNVSLKQSLIELPTIQVTAAPQASDPLTSPQPTSLLDGENLRIAQSASLGETIDQLPGVHNWSTGTGIGKPVIRGVCCNRVLVLDNGNRTDTQQWGDEHTANVSTAEAERVEVVRGPQSVLYGSDALGGVVNVIPKALPDAIDRNGFVSGNASVAYATNNEQPSGTATLEGASGGFGARASFIGLTSNDIRTPTGPLFNSGSESLGGAGALGYRAGWGSVRGTVSYTSDELQIHDDPADGPPPPSPFQRITETRAGADLNLPLGLSRLEVTGGYEHNNRSEYEAAGETTVASGLLLDTYTGTVHFHHPPVGRLQGIVGVSTYFDDFTVSGDEQHLIPDNGSQNAGIYAFEQIEAGKWNFSFGLRYDYRHLDVSQDPPPPIGTGTQAQTRNYNAITGNIGALFRVAEPVALVLNIGRGFRAPSAFDLFANGPHENTIEFDVGDPNLKNETSINTDLAVRLQSSRLAGEIGVFANYIDNFIYFQPTGQIDPGSGFEIFDAVQGNSRFTGLEASLQWHATSYLHLQATTDYVVGQNRSADQPLPWVPPFRATYSARLEGHSRGWFQSPYFSIGGESNATQTRVAPNDYAPPGYTLLNLGGGFTVPAGSGLLHLDLSLINVLDTDYTSFMSRYKTYAIAAGTNLIIRLGTDF